MALDPLQLDPKALAQVAQIKRDANMWASLNPFKGKAEIGSDEKSIAVMSEAERDSKLSGHELDPLHQQQAKHQKNNPAIQQAELYEQHMTAMAGAMGVETAGMNIDQIANAVQAAHDNPELAQGKAGDNYMTNFVGGDITAGQSCSMADVEASSPTCPDARTVDQEQITI